LALDEPRDGDQQIEHDGIPFLLGRDLERWLRQGRQVVIRYDDELDTFLVRLSGVGRC
jgi:hypothetical protein